MKVFRLFIALAIFGIVLLATYFIHVRFFKVDVVFYAAIFDGFIASVIVGAFIFQTKFFKCFLQIEKSLLIIIMLLCGYSFAISLPTVIDRSLSFYILEKLNQRGGGIEQDKFDIVFVKEYMVEHRLVDVRLTEQLSSGTIEIVDGCVKLTPKGENFVKFSRFFRTNLLPKKRLLLGEYSDTLTDPFRDSVQSPDYKCE